MSIEITCPSCGNAFQLPDTLRGKRVRCKRCDEAFAAEPDAPGVKPRKSQAIRERGTSVPVARPLDDAEPEPASRQRRSRGPAAPKSSRTLWILLSSVGAALVVLVLACGGVTYYLVTSDALSSPSTPPRNLNQALKGLKSGNSVRQGTCADWLAEQKVDAGRQAEVATALDPLLHSDSIYARISALKALRVWATADNVPSLLDVARQEPAGFNVDPENPRRLAFAVLGKLQDARAAPLLVKALSSWTEWQDAKNALSAMGPAAEKEVLLHVNDANQQVRQHARDLLGGYQTSNEAILKQTIADLRGVDPLARQAAIELLTAVGDRVDARNRGALAQLLDPLVEDPNDGIRQNALKALIALGGPESVPGLNRAVMNKSFGWGRASALEALERKPDRRSIPALRTVLTGGGYGDDEIRLAIRILGKLKDPTTVPDIARLLQHPFIWSNAKDGLLAIGPGAEQEVARLLFTSDNRTREVALDCLKRYGTKNSVILTQAALALRDADANQRMYACDWLAKAPVDEPRHAEIAKLLEPLLLQDDHTGVRDSAARALAVWATADSVQALVDVIDHDSQTVRFTAMTTLGKLKAARAAERIARRLTINADRTHASQALQLMGPAAEKDVLPYLKTNDWMVRVETCKVLKHIGTKDSVQPLLAALEYAETKEKFAGGTFQIREAVKDALTSITTRVGKQ